jgi:hypothetical protein
VQLPVRALYATTCHCCRLRLQGSKPNSGTFCFGGQNYSWSVPDCTCRCGGGVQLPDRALYATARHCCRLKLQSSKPNSGSFCFGGQNYSWSVPDCSRN